MRRVLIGLLLGVVILAGWRMLRTGPMGSGIAPTGPTPETNAAASLAADVGAPSRPDNNTPTQPARAEFDAPPIARGRGGLRVRVTLAPDGVALAHVAVQVVALDGRAEDVTRRVIVTDADGLAQFDALDEGRWQVELDRWPKADAVVTVDAMADLTITVPAGATAIARVFSAEGVRVAGAEVTFWGANGWLDIPAGDDGVVVGKTDPDGELRLAGLPNMRGHGCWLAAHHATLGTSMARMVTAPANENDVATRVVELRLGLAGASLEVRVTDDAGQPLAGAHVVMHPVDQPNSHDDGNGRILAHLQRGARTDGHGLAQLSTLATGDYGLRVRAAGHATFRSPLRVEDQARLTRDIALTREARMHGRVVATDGTPVAAVAIVVQHDAGDGSVSSGSDGRFELGGLSAGAATWTATHAAFAHVKGTVALVRAEVAAVHVTLSPLARVHGRLIDASDRGLVGWSISAQGNPGSTPTTTTGPDGAFTLPADAALEYTLRVCEPGLRLPVPIANVNAVRSTPDPLVIRVPDDARATAYLEGMLLDSADRPAIEGQFLSVDMGKFRVHPGRTSRAAEIDARTGRFRVGPLPPGTCTLTFASLTSVEFSIADLALLPSSTTQLGRVVVPASGIVRAELQAEAGLRLDDVLVQLDGLGDTDIFRVDTTTLTAAKSVLPGRYRAKVYGKGFRWLDQPIDVIAGQTTTIRGTLRAAARFGVRLHMPADERGAMFVIRDATNGIVFDTELDAGTEFKDSWPFLDRGSFEVEATGKSGRLYRARFTVETLERRTIPHDVRVEPVR